MAHKSKVALERQERRKRRREAVQQAKESRAKKKPSSHRPLFFGKARKGDAAQVEIHFSGLEIPCEGLADASVEERFEAAKEQFLTVEVGETRH
jgi:hypothetical protein